jgi:hypothetical protein
LPGVCPGRGTAFTSLSPPAARNRHVLQRLNQPRQVVILDIGFLGSTSIDGMVVRISKARAMEAARIWTSSTLLIGCQLCLHIRKNFCILEGLSGFVNLPSRRPGPEGHSAASAHRDHVGIVDNHCLLAMTRTRTADPRFCQIRDIFPLSLFFFNFAAAVNFVTVSTRSHLHLL